MRLSSSSKDFTLLEMLIAMTTTDIEVRISGNQRSLDQAFCAADAGVDDGLAWLLGMGTSAPAESSPPTMDETKHEFDSHYYSRYRITDLHYTDLPPLGLELTMFEKHYYRVNSIGGGINQCLKGDRRDRKPRLSER